MAGIPCWVEAASCAATTEAPHRQKSRRGGIPGEPLALHEVGLVTLCSKQKSSPFWTIFDQLGRGHWTTRLQGRARGFSHTQAGAFCALQNNFHEFGNCVIGSVTSRRCKFDANVLQSTGNVGKYFQIPIQSMSPEPSVPINADPCFAREGRARHALDRADRRRCCPSDPWRPTSSIRSNPDFGSDTHRLRTFDPPHQANLASLRCEV
jgi:hypothetical protein